MKSPQPPYASDPIAKAHARPARHRFAQPAVLVTLVCASVVCRLPGSGRTTQSGAASTLAPATTLSAERIDDRIVVRAGAGTFTCYRFGQGQKYPYFYPVNGPASRESLTSESALPYPHHRSLFFGCDRVNGGNYWQEGNERGQILSQGPAITLNGPEAVEFTDLCLWRQPGRDPSSKSPARSGSLLPPPGFACSTSRPTSGHWSPSRSRRRTILFSQSACAPNYRSRPEETS